MSDYISVDKNLLAFSFLPEVSSKGKKEGTIFVGPVGHLL